VLVLGQRATAEKSNEKTAIPELLATLALQGSIVTIDAMGTQPNIAQAIRDRGADYLLAVKDNQPRLAESIDDFFGAFVAAPAARSTLPTPIAMSIEVPAQHSDLVTSGAQRQNMGDALVELTRPYRRPSTSCMSNRPDFLLARKWAARRLPSAYGIRLLALWPISTRSPRPQNITW
jgi:hypothetical protein